MSMSKTIFNVQPIPPSLAKPLAIAAILAILALSIGGALAERMELRAAEDRLSVGTTEQG